MTPSPFTRLNTARIRADRRAALLRTIAQAVPWILLALAALIVLDTARTTALTLPATLAQAEALKGM